MSQNQESAGSLAALQVKELLDEMVAEMLHRISVQIHAQKSSLDPTNFATFQKLLSDHPTHYRTLNGSVELQLSLELSNPPSQTSGT